MKAEEKLITGIRAGYSFFFIRTAEMESTVEKIRKAVKEEKSFQSNPYKLKLWDFEESPDPEKFLLEEVERSEARTVFIAKNLNWFLVDEFKNFNKLFLTYLQNRLEEFPTAEKRKVLIILSDTSFQEAIPDILQRDFMSIEFELPDESEVSEILEYILSSVREKEGFQEPDEKEKEQILNSSRGMTAREIQNAFAYSVIQDGGTIKSTTVAGIRAKNIESAAGLQVCNYERGFESLKGYENVKAFTLATATSPEALGIMLLGPPGTGKTHFATCLAKELNKLMLKCEMAEMFGKFVGDTEKAIGKMIQVVKANAPCILFLDEIEKALAGVGGKAGDQDISIGSEVTQRSMSQFLKFLSDERPKGVYVIATCNNIDSLPPEWVRAERWDTAPFFIDLPNEEEQEEILLHYQATYGVFGNPLSMKGWSGAEIKACCRIAKLMDKDVNEVERFIIPVARTMDREIKRLREWAETRTIPASMPINGGKKKGTRSLD